MKKIKMYDVVLLSLLSAILLITDQLLVFLPNFQVTFLLIILYSKKLGITKTILIILTYVTIDNLIMGSFDFYYVPTMMIGFSLIPITINTIFKKIDNVILLGLIGVMHAFIYSWLFIIPTVFLYQIDIINYLIMDIPYELILAASTFITVFGLYRPLIKLFNHYIK